MTDAAMKSCPYCAEAIRAEAVKCRWCGSTLGNHALTRTWYRSRRGKMVAGVCAGLAAEFGVSVTMVRLAFLLGTLVGGGMGIVIYLALWVVMPYEPETAADLVATSASASVSASVSASDSGSSGSS